MVLVLERVKKASLEGASFDNPLRRPFEKKTLDKGYKKI